MSEGEIREGVATYARRMVARHGSEGGDMKTTEERVEEFNRWLFRDGMRRLGDAGLREPSKRECSARERKLTSILEAHAREAADDAFETCCVWTCEDCAAAVAEGTDPNLIEDNGDWTHVLPSGTRRACGAEYLREEWKGHQR